MPLYHEGKEQLSAKWRRSRRNPQRPGIFKAFMSAKEKGTPVPYLDGWKTRKKLYSNRQRIPEASSERGMKEPEPLLDIFEEKGEIIVVVGFAGFKKDSLKTNVESHKLTLYGEALNRRYYKSLNLPKRVIPNTIRTKYQNGVLEIRLKKAVREKTLDKVAY
jgi:HSP20 family molecular chaperone IbpA